MADSSPETMGETMESDYSSSEDQTTQIVKQKMMGQVQQLVEQNKYTALIQVIELSTQHVNQRKEIAKLQQHIKKVLEQRGQTKSDLIVQHNFKTNVQSIEDLKHATSIRLREKLEAINAHIKSNDAMRSHLKEDDAVARTEMEEIKKLLNELTEKANVLQRALKKGEGHLKTLKQQLHSAAAEKDNLQQDCHAKEREMHNISSHNAEIMQQIQNELMDKESSVKQRTEELKREQQTQTKQANAYEQLQSELNAMRNNVEQLKQTVDSELLKEKEVFRREIAFSEKSFEEMKMKNESMIAQMTNSITDLVAQTKKSEERINEQRNRQNELCNNLRYLQEQNSKLKQEQENYNRNKLQEMEFARLKESIKASKTSGNEVASKKSAFIMRPKRQVYINESKNNKKVTAKKNPPTDSEPSSAFDESICFDGKL
ncbi:myosin heavy chain, clone 203-like isoform X2 [Anopheles moucheti]|uniref:myosin heavy chain, clone 203-like isoform X2 n=1 Tax=Anopheles moucheti TaxID=186751 RepID=UPI0022F1359F|nr:myosin heavy chain, clone 203-like isoform X2 [Anopheles moucheti]